MQTHEKRLKRKNLEKLEQVLQTKLILKEYKENFNERSYNNHGCGQGNRERGSFNSSNNEGTNHISYLLTGHGRWHNLRQNERGRCDNFQIQYYNCKKYGRYI